ncbi:MAG TPA: outer membrane protein assembly factor BamE [Usitatibacter sp.]|jgi:outer membrane protein assembly factor BamE|nr:outer membrane protein assembly factor BamE [Usitatibacter sp.]
MRLLALLVLSALLSACVYKIDVEQGNFVTTDLVEKLKSGMTKNQVKQVLGTPLLSDVFHADRWDYYFDNSKGGRKLAHKRFTVFFKDDKLVSFTGDVNPPLPPPTRVSAEPAPAPAAPAPAAPAPPQAPPPAK